MDAAAGPFAGVEVGLEVGVEVGVQTGPEGAKAGDEAAPHDPCRPWTAAHFLTFSNDTPPFARNARAFCESAREVGFASATHIQQDDLRDTPFWRRHAETLEQPRGAGYWLWKPHIIREKLQQMAPGEVLIYSDAGRGLVHHLSLFDEMPETLLKLAGLSPKGFLLGWSSNWATQARFTKGDCFHLLGANTPEMWNAPQIAATWSIWTPSQDAFKFLGRWLKACMDPRILTDLPDSCGTPAQSDLDRHLHDQAAMSILAHQTKAPYLKFHTGPAKQAMIAARAQAKSAVDFLKRVPNVDAVLDRLLPEGFLAADQPDPADLSAVIGYFDPREGVPDLSAARGGRPAGQQTADLLRLAREAPEQIGWSEVHVGTPKPMRAVVQRLYDGLTKPQILSLRETLIKDVQARLPLTPVPNNSPDMHRLRQICTDVILARAGQMDVDIDDTRWSELWRAMPGDVRNLWRWTILHLPPRTQPDLRADMARRFAQARRTAPSDQLAYLAIADDLAALHAELPGGMDKRSIFPAWWAIWQNMDAQAQGRWAVSVRGLADVDLVARQEALVQAMSDHAPGTPAWHTALEDALEDAPAEPDTQEAAA
ncbi:MAG: hypothetical protein AAF674_10215 [Pseudomonadota bacterium]